MSCGTEKETAIREPLVDLNAFTCKVCLIKRCSIKESHSEICETCQESIIEDENLRHIRLILGKKDESVRVREDARVLNKISSKFLNPNWKTDIRLQRLQHELTLEFISLILNTFEFMKGHEGPNGEGIVELLDYYGLSSEHVDGIKEFLNDRDTQATDKVFIADFFSKRKTKRSWIHTIFDIRDGEDEDECDEPPPKKSKSDSENPYDKIEILIREMCEASAYMANKSEVFDLVKKEFDGDGKLFYMTESHNNNHYKPHLKEILRTIEEEDAEGRKRIYASMQCSTFMAVEGIPGMIESWISKIKEDLQ